MLLRSVDKYQRRRVSVCRTLVVGSGGSGMNRRRSLSCIILVSTLIVTTLTFLLPIRLLPSIQEYAWHYALQSAVPTCPSTPWKSHENLRGKCALNPYNIAMTMDECATSCCNDDKCITWQFRRDVGCLHGDDLRLGMEKDGPAAWCSDHKSYKWHGQNLVWKDTTRQLACSEKTWDPNEQSGQCLGLGDVRLESSKSAHDCMHACCNDETCNSWQWNEIVSFMCISRNSFEIILFNTTVFVCINAFILRSNIICTAWLFLWQC